MRALGLCLLAVLLSALTLTWEFEKLDCSADVCKPNSHAILVVDLPEHRLVSTGKIVSNVPPQSPFVDGGIGLYARWGLPGWAGGLIGIVIPVLMIAWSVVLVRRRRSVGQS
ncbi:MAG: hypothetical protein JSR60_18510 [Proteobacteria bacterium]|nr:hypothetical protein [Pseudomonadota bacterium]